MHELVHHQTVDGQPIPLLQEAIDAVKGLALMNIDLKSAGGEERLVELIVNKGVEEDVLISSFHAKSLRKIKQLEPKIQTGISLPRERFHLSSLEKIAPIKWPILIMMRKIIRFLAERQIEKAQADAVMLHYQLLSPGLVKYLNGLGVPVYTFTVDDERSIRKVVDMGVHGIASNRPELLLRY